MLLSKRQFASCAVAPKGVESEWRFNLAKFGLSGLGYQLCARVVTPFNNLLLVKETDILGSVWTTNTPGSVLLPVRVSTFAIGPADVFPYGVAVHPD